MHFLVESQILARLEGSAYGFAENMLPKLSAL